MTTFVPYDCTVILYRCDVRTFRVYAEDGFPLRVLGPAQATPDQMRDIAHRASAKARRIIGREDGPYLLGVRVGAGDGQRHA